MIQISFVFGTLFVIVTTVDCSLTDLATCHDDFTLHPPDGILQPYTFTWVGFIQYIHKTTGLPHASKAPRVTLIHKQFVVGTASDMLRLPKDYELGSVIFGEYERDEILCNLTLSQIRLGVKCPRTYLEMPTIEITPHPEYTRFGVGNSLAIVKLARPIESRYMLPICMPSSHERARRKNNKVVFLTDYISSVPWDFDNERMGKKTLKLYTHRECRRHRMRSKLGSEGVTHVLCTSGCGVRHGAPIATQNTQGVFELVGIAAGGAPCTRRAMRQRMNEEPPIYVDVYPYVTWIVNMVTAVTIPAPAPMSFRRNVEGALIGIKPGRTLMRDRNQQRVGWRGRTFVTGNFCYQPFKYYQLATMFYMERFEVISPPATLHMNLKISAGIETTIVCARLTLPNFLSSPKFAGVGGYNITLTFQTDKFPITFWYTVGLVGQNTSARAFGEWLNERSPGFWGLKCVDLAHLCGALVLCIEECVTGLCYVGT